MQIIIFLLLTAFAICLISLPLFRKLDEHPSTQLNKRVNTLDGLRGFLAFAVLVSHLDVNWSYLNFGLWGNHYNFYALLGFVAVGLFFMMTAFLFWGKLMSSKGKTDWIILYVNRFFRIAPVYYVALLLALIFAFYSSNFSLSNSLGHVILSIGKWMFLGLFDNPEVNSFPMTRILGVTWTLRYEWLFYFSLFLTSFFIRKRLSILFCVLAVVATFLYTYIFQPYRANWAMFSMGIVAVTVIRYNFYKYRNNLLESIIACLCLIAIFAFYNDASGLIQVCLLGLFFFLIANGCTLFGLLTLKGCIRFGNISYSLYLFHMFFMYTFFKLPFVKNIAIQSQLNFWLLSIPYIIFIIGLSSICYYKIEKWGIEFGRKSLKKYYNRSKV